MCMDRLLLTLGEWEGVGERFVSITAPALHPHCTHSLPTPPCHPHQAPPPHSLYPASMIQIAARATSHACVPLPSNPPPVTSLTTVPATDTSSAAPPKKMVPAKNRTLYSATQRPKTPQWWSNWGFGGRGGSEWHVGGGVHESGGMEGVGVEQSRVTSIAMLQCLTRLMQKPHWLQWVVRGGRQMWLRQQRSKVRHQCYDSNGKSHLLP